MNQSNPLPVKIKLQQDERSGKPSYANFTTVQHGQGKIVIDFGFFDPKLLQVSVNVDNKPLGVIDAHLSRRIILSQEVATQFAQQLSQLFTKHGDVKEPQSESVMTDTLPSEIQDHSPEQGENLSENPKKGFRFPWFKKK
ncbi:MAG: hypothetical protein E6Q61_08695 [Nitrosomonas sp.]|nr:MAG: hypothetical protein E6Q61_08695 [Nitrosomonas sp.]